MSDLIQMPVCQHMKPIKFYCPECASQIDELPEYRQPDLYPQFAKKLDLHVLQEEGKKRDDIINQILHQVHDLTILVHNINQWIAAKEQIDGITRG